MNMGTLKITIPLVVFIVISSMVSATVPDNISAQRTDQGQNAENETGLSTPQGPQVGQNETGQGQQENVEQQTQNTGENMTIQVQQREEVRARNASELQEIIEQRQQEMNQEIRALREDQQEVYQNQNKVRLAVYSLLAMEDLAGGIGPQISQIAREFNNSVQATIRAEDRIQTRNSFIRFLVGGDEDAAQEIEQNRIQNQERIRQLQQLVKECACDEDVRAMIQEQIQNMEQEQTRLQQLANNEKNDKGLLGWLWK